MTGGLGGMAHLPPSFLRFARPPLHINSIETLVAAICGTTCFEGLTMSISSVGAALAPLAQTAAQAAPSPTTAGSRSTQDAKPHHHHGGGGPKPASDPTSTTTASSSSSGTTLNQLV